MGISGLRGRVVAVRCFCVAPRGKNVFADMTRKPRTMSNRCDGCRRTFRLFCRLASRLPLRGGSAFAARSAEQKSECHNYYDGSERYERYLRNRPCDQRHQPECRQRGFLVGSKTVREPVADEEGDRRSEHHHVVVEAIGRGEKRGER